MKKVVFSLIIGLGFMVEPICVLANPSSFNADPICVPGTPCAYTGRATAENGSWIDIKVYISNGQYVARFIWNTKEAEAYCIKAGSCKYYINWEGKKYFFEM